MRALELLKGAGASLEAVDGNGRTPLALAIFNHNSVAIKWLCEHGANPNVKLPNGRFLIQHAAILGQWNVVCHLLRAGANPYASDNGEKCLVDFAQEIRDLTRTEPWLRPKHGWFWEAIADTDKELGNVTAEEVVKAFKSALSVSKKN